MRKIIEHKTELTIVGAKCRWHNELGGKLEYKILSKPKLAKDRREREFETTNKEILKKAKALMTISINLILKNRIWTIFFL